VFSQTFEQHFINCHCPISVSHVRNDETDIAVRDIFPLYAFSATAQHHDQPYLKGTVFARPALMNVGFIPRRSYLARDRVHRTREEGESNETFSFEIAALLSLGWRKLVARQTRKAEEREGVTPVRNSRHQAIKRNQYD
jgi:hypothetical protein